MILDVTIKNDDEYFAYKAVSASQLKEFAHGAYDFWKKSVFNPAKEPTEDTDALIFGKLTHCLLLEPETFETNFTIQEFGKLRKNQAYSKLKEQYQDKVIVNAEEHTHAKKMIEALNAHPLAKNILTGAKTELPIIWTDENTGLPCKAKIDAVKRTARGIVIIDYKTSRDIDALIKYPHKLGYHLQDTFYRRAIKEKYGEEPVEFIFIVQSNIEGEEDKIAILNYSAHDITTSELIIDNYLAKIAEKLGIWTANKAPNPWQAYPSRIELCIPNYYYEDNTNQYQ